MTEAKTPKGKTALPKDWEPSETVRTWAKVNARDIDFHGTLLEFRDYAHGRDWRMADWDATFRNWLRKASKVSKGKPMFAGAEKPPPPRETFVQPGPQQCKWQVAANRILLTILLTMQGVPPDKLAVMVERKRQMGQRLKSLYGDREAPDDEWRTIVRDGAKWLRNAAL